MKRPVKITAVDLFCGAGGLIHGLARSGICVKAGVDVNPLCKYPVERNNAGCVFVEKDVAALTGADVAAFYGDEDVCVLAGCAPCQRFSTYTQKRVDPDGVEWGLLREFGRIVGETRPHVVTMENVVRLKRHKVYDEFKNVLDGLGYVVSVYEVDCRDYGVPQTRRRLVLFASVFGEVPKPAVTRERNDYATVRETIGSLEPLKAGETSSRDPFHRAKNLSEINMKRIKSSTPGGTWRDWDKRLVAKCHKKMKRGTYVSVYGRMEWDESGPTITTQCCGFGNGRFGHPKQNRAISLREAALLQTFPSDYKFFEIPDDASFEKAGALIGNAVPVNLGEAVGKTIVKHVKDSLYG